MPLKKWEDLKAQIVEPAKQATTIAVIAVLLAMVALVVAMGKSRVV